MNDAIMRDNHAEQVYPLTPTQLQVAYHSIAHPEIPEVYAVQHTIGFPGKINTDVMRDVLTTVMQHCAILRGSVITVAEQMLSLRIAGAVDLNFQIIDLEGSDQQTIQQIADADRRRGFADLNQALCRFSIITTNSKDYLVWTFHHILMGADSMHVMHNILLTYQAALSSSLTYQPYALSYADCLDRYYANNQDDGVAYWDALLKDYRPNGHLLQNTLPQYDGGFKQQAMPFAFDAEQVTYIEQFSEKHQIRVNNLLQLAWGQMIAVLSGQQDIVFGVVRAFPQLAHPMTPGPWFQTFPLRLRLSDDTTQHFLHHIAEQNRQMNRLFYTQPNQSYRAQEGEDAVRLFQTMYEFKTRSFEQSLRSSQLPANMHYAFNLDMDMALCLEVCHESRQIHGRLHYDARLFTACYAQTLTQYLTHITLQLMRCISVSMMQIDLLSPKDHCFYAKHLMAQACYVSEPSDLYTYYYRGMQAYKDKICLVEKDQHYSFTQLQSDVSYVNQLLKRQGIQENIVVAFCLEQRYWQVVSILAVLSLGASYVPLDVEWPEERLVSCLDLAKATYLLLNNAALVSQFKQKSIQAILLANKGELKSPAESLSLFSGCEDASALAYTIFTSGTTGQPKGVQISHQAVMTTLQAMQDICAIQPKDMILALSAVTFDLSVFDIFGMLSQGAGIVYPAANEKKDPQCWIRLMQQHAISIWNGVPALFELFIQQLTYCDEATLQILQANLRLVLLSGDVITPTLLNSTKHYFPGARVICLGGATEGSIWSIAFEASEYQENMKRVPYGLPLPGQSAYVLDDHDRLLGCYMPGEYCIGGDALALGYCSHNPEDYQRFFYHAALGMRLYRTGDKAYLDDCGQLIILGRKDTQVKVGGCRIETAEIESVLNSFGFHRAAVVVDESQRILVYYMGDVSESDLLNSCKRRLPTYMMPHVFFKLEALPLSANGKLMRADLPTLLGKAKPMAIDSADKLFKQVVAVFKKLFPESTIDATVPIYVMGITSMMLISLLIALREAFNVALQVSDIYAVSNIYELVKMIRQKMQSGITESKPLEAIQTSFMQSIWKASQILGHTASYNIPLCFSCVGDFSMDAISQMLKHFIIKNKRVFGYYYDASSQMAIADDWISYFSVECIDLVAFNDYTQKTIIHKAANIGFDLTKPPLCRLACFQCTSDKIIVLFTVHHMIMDQYAMVMVVDAIKKMLLSCHLRPQPVPMLPCQSLDQISITPNQNMLAYENYIDQLSSAKPGSLLRYATKVDQGLKRRGCFDIDSVVDVAKLKIFAKEVNLSSFMVLLTIWQTYLCKLLSVDKHVISLPVSSRYGYSGFGMFSNLLPLPFNLDNQLSIKQLCIANAKQIRLALSFQDVPLERILQDVERADGSRPSLFDIVMYEEVGFCKAHNDQGAIEVGLIPLDFSKYDMSIACLVINNSYKLRIDYNKQMYTHHTLVDLFNGFVKFTQACVNHSDSLGEIFIISSPKIDDTLRV